MLEFIEVCSDKDISLLADTANEVWHEYFPCILSDAQIDYMVEKFQSEKALKAQIADGYNYYMAAENSKIIGYIGVKTEKDRLFLSKLYVLKNYRGKGYGLSSLNFVERLCKNAGAGAIYLTVNRKNEHSINVYLKNGFKIIKEQAADIGKGFVMDDYIMEKKVER